MKYAYNIRKGDAIRTSEGMGIVTKLTKNYVYYYYNDHVAKVRKVKLWQYLDDLKKSVDLNYGNGTKYRRKQRKMRTLDLHRTKHKDVPEKVRSFLNFVELPCRIITGKSHKMKEIVKEIVEEYEYSVSPLCIDCDGGFTIIDKWEH